VRRITLILIIVVVTSSTSYGMGRAYPYYIRNGVRCYTSGGSVFGRFYGRSYNHGRSYGGHDRDLNRVMGVGSLGVGIYQVATEAQLQNREMRMAEKEQEFQHQQAQPQQEVVYVPQPVQQAAYTPSRVVYGVQLPPRQPQQQVATQPTASSPVIVPANLTRTAEEIAERIKQQEADKANSAESAKIKAEIERLKLELEKSKLELEKSKLQKELEKTKAN